MNLQKQSLQRGATENERALSGILTEEIDELRWLADLAGSGQIDVPIFVNVGLKFSFQGILDSPVAAIRAYYTSSID